jgi:hypothetical protein
MVCGERLVPRDVLERDHCPRVWELAVGTVQSPVIELKSVPPFSSVSWL